MRRGLCDELLVPFRGGGQAARALVTGSAIILRCGCRGVGRAHRNAVRYVRTGELGFSRPRNDQRKPQRALAAGRKEEERAAASGEPFTESFGDAAERLGLGLLVCAVACVVAVSGGMELRRLATPYMPVIGSVAGLVWVVAAWIAAPPASYSSRKHHEAEAQKRQSAATRPDPQVDADAWLLTFILECAAYAEKASHKGVHLAVIANELRTASPAFERWDVGAVRAHCERLGVPLRRSLRTPDGVTLGLHLDDLTAVLGMPPSQALAALHRTPTEAAALKDTSPADTTQPSSPAGTPATTAVPRLLASLLRRRPFPSPETAA